MNKLLIAIVLGVIIVGGISAYFIIRNNSPTTNVAITKNTLIGNSVANQQNIDTQKIILSLKNGNYYPNTIRLKKDVPAEIILDDSVVGCFRSFNVKDLGISKYSRSPSEVVSFTPVKAGTYTFLCSMGMGYGTMIVT